MLDPQDYQLIYGQAALSGFDSRAGGLPLHPIVIEPFHRLQQSACKDGVGLTIASGFRNFQRQLLIWNRKARGELPVLSSDGRPLNLTMLCEREQVFAILRWSALPGASRHHWGTDMDVYDSKVILPENYRVQLTVEEANTLFASLHQWLNRVITEKLSFGFFRPYHRDTGGVAPEQWHLSYAPLASEFQQAFSIDILAEILTKTDIALKKAVLDNLDEIEARFIRIPSREC